MTFVAVGDRAEGRADKEGTPGEGGKAQPRARARTRSGSVTRWSALTERVADVRAARGAVGEDGQPDPVRGRSPWTAGAASPAAVLAYTRAGSWVPGEQDLWLERLGKLYGYLALAITVLVTLPLWVIQRPSRLGLTLIVGVLLYVTWGPGGGGA